MIEKVKETLYLFARAAITNVTTGWLKQQSVFLIVLEAGSLRVRCQQD